MHLHFCTFFWEKKKMRHENALFTLIYQRLVRGLDKPPLGPDPDRGDACFRGCENHIFDCRGSFSTI